MKKFAQIISIILHPFVLFDLGIIFIVGEYFNWGIQKLIVWIGFLAVVDFILIGFIRWGMRTRHFSNFDVSKRKQRFLLYQVIIIISIFFYFFGLAVGVSDLLLKFCILFLVFIILLEIINIKIKASVHIASVTIISIAVAFYYRGIFMYLPLLIPLLAWSRVYSKRHTVKEVSIGFLVGLLILFLANFIIGRSL